MRRWIFEWLTAVAASLPLRVGYALARALTGFHFAFFPARRHAALANLAVALPTLSRRERARIVRRMMFHYNAFLFEFFRLPHLDREELVRSVHVEGRQDLEAAVARRRGVVVVSSHLGNWELAAVLVATWGHRLHAVAGIQFTRWLTPAVREARSELAVETVAPEDGFKKLFRALGDGDVVALMVDGNIYTHPSKVEMFGRQTPFPAGPAVLAMRTGSLVVPGYCERLGGGRFRIVIEPALDPTSYPDLASFSQAIASRVERHIRDHIEQWCIFRPVWEGVPESQESLEAETRSALA